MGEIVLPNYHGGSIVNLMSSISHSFGVKNPYEELKILPSSEINKKNIILLVIDGMGFEYLKNQKNSILNENLQGEMTSVFLPTTACAIPTFLTGFPPQQHGLTGWFMFLKELGSVIVPLRFSTRDGHDLDDANVDFKDIFNQNSFANKIKAKTYYINPNDVTKAKLSNYVSSKSKILPFSTITGLFTQIKKAVKSNNKKKYIYAYSNLFDELCHRYGTESKKTISHFNEINKKLRSFVKSIRGTDTLLIITADHGFINSSKKEVIDLKDHPKLKECLTLPLCGESRVCYCYVHPDKTQDFENYVKTNLSKYCDIHKSSDLIKQNYFGLFEPNPHLADRVGDYTLICKENYLIKDSILGKKSTIHKGNHGGVSRNEMIVPLVVIGC